MRRHLPLPGRRSAFTLLEAAIALSLVVVLMSSAILAAKGGQGAFRATQAATDLETRTRRALDRIAMELVGAGDVEPISALLGTSAVVYSQARPWDWDKSGSGAGDSLNGLTVLWGPRSRISLELEPGETNDGTDEDNDGLVDEGQVVLTRDYLGLAQRSYVLCTGVRELLEHELLNGWDDNDNDKDGTPNEAGDIVDEAGFNVHRVGEVLFLKLSLEESSENGNIVRTLETSVRLRN